MSRSSERGLGRGLGALIPRATIGLREVPVGDIRPNPWQPRTHFDEQDLEAGLGRDLDDARPHEPTPDDADVRDGHAMPRFARDRRDGGMSSGYFRARPGSGGGS